MLPEDEIRELFPSFEPELLREMSEVCSLRSFAEGAVLMKTGQYIRSTMIILSGLVKVSREDGEGGEFFMYYIEPGQACALTMVCSIRQNISELTAKAVSDLEVISIPLDRMDSWMMRYRSWYQFVLGTYRSRFEDLLTTIDQIAFRNMDERLVFYLKKNAESLKTNIIPFTHAEIAAELNSSREVVSRLLKKLAERGLIRLHRQSIEIIDKDQFPV